MLLRRYMRVVLAASVVFIMLAPSVLACVNCQSAIAKHDCCGGSDGVRLPAQTQECCVVNAPPSTPSLTSTTTPVSAAPVVVDHRVHVGVIVTSISALHDAVDTSPPSCSSVLRI